MERSDEVAYDNTARILGRGTASVGGAYILPYLQSGHMLLLGVLLLASTISYPGDHMHAHAYMHMHMHAHAYMHTCIHACYCGAAPSNGMAGFPPHASARPYKP